MKNAVRTSVTTKTPFRITLTGGSDLIPYVKRYGGTAFGATIDKFVTVTVSLRKDGFISLSYPEGEELVKSASDIQNPIIRQAFISHEIDGGINLISTSDIPPGSGLGSSGAFTVGLLNALHALKGEKKSQRDLAEEAVDLEINKLKAPIGKYDQYMAAFGGTLHLVFEKDGNVVVNRINFSNQVRERLEKELMLVFSGMKRSASAVLNVVNKRFETSEEIFADIADFIKLGDRLRGYLLDGRVDDFAANINNLLAAKKKCYVSCTNERLDQFIEAGYRAGAIGAKIIGAGAGGFVYFYVPPEKQENFKKGITAAGGTVFPFCFVNQGSQIVDEK